MKARCEKFPVWSSIGESPAFKSAESLKIYLCVAGWVARFGKPACVSHMQRLFVHSSRDRRAFQQLVDDAAFVIDQATDRMSVSEQFGCSGAQLLWLPAVKEERVRNKRRAVDPKLRFTILRRDGFRCVYCGAASNDSELHVDHVIPVSKGGCNSPSNLVTACADCNLGKGATQLQEPLQ